MTPSDPTMSSSFEDPYTDTADDARGRMFDTIDDLYPDTGSRPDTREGSLLWTTFATVGAEFEVNYAKLNEILELSFVQFSRGTYLDDLGNARGLTRLQAAQSGGLVRFMGDDGAIVTAGIAVSTAAENDTQPSYLFDTTESGTVLALPDPPSPPTAASGGSGVITGDVVYKFLYVTPLNTIDHTRGYTSPSPASTPALTLTGQEATVTIPALSVPTDFYTRMDATNGGEDVVPTEVRVYRSYRPTGTSTLYSPYRYVGSLHGGAVTAGGTLTDNVADADFALINEDATGTEGLTDANSTGLVDVQVQSQDAGATTAVLAGSIQLLESAISGIEAVANPSTLIGGRDAELDDDFRKRILEDAQKSAGAGNKADYIGWAKEKGAVGVNVVPEWRGPGTVLVVTSAEGNEPSTTDELETIRDYIAGDIAILDPATPIASGTVATTGGSIAAGTYEYAYAFMDEGGGETLPSPLLVVPVGGTTTSAVTLVSIPVGPTGTGPVNTFRVRVYRKRTLPSAEDWRKVVDLPNIESAPGSGHLANYVDTALTSTLDTTSPVSGNSTSLYNGVAPIGAHVTVETITQIPVSLYALVTPQDGYTLTGETGKIDLAPLIHASEQAYFKTLIPGAVGKYVDIANALHDTVGVADFSGLLVAGGTSNLSPGASSSLTYDSVGSTYDPA